MSIQSKIMAVNLLIAGTMFGGAYFAGTGTAKADEMTDYFVASEAGPAVCEYFSHGVTEGSLIRLGEIMLENTDMDPDQAAVFIRDSVDVYCPEFASPLVDVVSGWQSGDAKYKRLV